MATPLLSMQFRLNSGQALQALSEVSFTVNSGETLGIAGESGCGKSFGTEFIAARQPRTGAN